MERPRKRVKVNAGDVVAVPLPMGGFGFMRAMRDKAFEVRRLHAEAVIDASLFAESPVSHYVVGTDDAIRRGDWPVIGSLPFASEDEAWGPPFATCYVAERNWWTMGAPRISHRGKERFANLSEVAGLEVLGVAHRPDLIVDSIVRRMIQGDESRTRRVPKA